MPLIKTITSRLLSLVYLCNTYYHMPCVVLGTWLDMEIMWMMGVFCKRFSLMKPQVKRRINGAFKIHM